MSVSSALRKLRLERTSRQYLEEFYRQIDADDNDRGAAILAAVTVESTLENAISRHLFLNAQSFGELFDNQGPLGTFDDKIIFAHAIKIIGPFTRKNIDIIKHIRNTFAHAGIPVLFSTPAIMDACNALMVPPQPETFSHRDLVMLTPRQRYTGICEATAVALSDYAAGCGRIRADLMKPGAMIPVMPAPLP